jgi:hypothetical protein
MRMVNGLLAASWTFNFLPIPWKLGLLGVEEVGKRIGDFEVFEPQEAILAAEHPTGH